jgi:hypothetical protein
MHKQVQRLFKATLLGVAFVFCFAHMIAFAQSGATLIDTFNLERLPYRDLSINCGGGLFLFGDTFASLSPAGGWRPNTGGLVSGGRLSALNGDAALWQPDGDASASVPSGCARYGGQIVAWYTDATTLSGHDFQAVSGGVVISNDGGATWTKHRLFDGDGGRAQAALVTPGDGYLYTFMAGAGRVGAATLARTGDPVNAGSYAWWNGGGWGAWESAAAVIPGTVGEASICWNGMEWLAAYLDPALNGTVQRRSPSLVGPWGEAEMLVDWGLAHGTYSPQWLDCGRRFLLSHFEANTINGLTWPAYNVYEWVIG